MLISAVAELLGVLWVAAEGLVGLHFLFEDLARLRLVFPLQDQLRQPLAIRIVVAAAENEFMHFLAGDVDVKRL